MPLLTQAYPFPPESPLESMRGFLRRLGCLNHYTQERWYESLFPPPYHVPNNLRRTAHFAALSASTGLSIQVLRDMTLHRFVPFYYSAQELQHLEDAKSEDELDGQLWERRWFTRYIRGSRCAQVCPLCWQQWPSILLPWELRHITTCPVHKVLLVDRCGTCEQPLHLDLTTGKCRQCAAHVSTFSTTSISEHKASLKVTALMYHAIGLGEWAAQHGVTVEYDSLQTDNPLRKMDCSTVLRFFWRFAQLIATRDPHNPLFDTALLPAGVSWSNSSVLSTVSSASSVVPPANPWSGGVAQLHGVLAAVCRLLLEWPQTWHTTLERLAAIEVERSPSIRWPRILSHQFDGPEWAWLNASWMKFVEENALRHPMTIGPWLISYRAAKERAGEAPHFLTPEEVATLLRSTPLKVYERIKARLLVAMHVPMADGYNVRTFITDESARHFHSELQSLRALLTTNDVRLRYGLERSQLMSLVEAGMLQAEVTPSTNEASNKWLFADGALSALLRSILEPVPYRPLPLLSEDNDDATLNLSEVAHRLSRIGVQFPRLLKIIANGELRAFCREDVSSLKGLWFYASDVRSYKEWKYLEKSAAIMSSRDVCKQLGCKRSVLRELASVGLLRPVNHHIPCIQPYSRYYRSEVEAFAERYVTAKQAAAIIGCSVESLRKCSRKKLLPAECVPYRICAQLYFSREAITTWQHDLVDAKEAAQILGVGLDTVAMWVREGVLHRFEWFGSQQSWLSRVAVKRKRAGWASTKEVARMTGASEKVIMKWVNNGTLVPLAKQSNNRFYWFSRHEVEEWQRGRLTLQEAAALLGMKPGTMRKKVSQGRLDIQPLADRTMKRLWFARSDVVKLLECNTLRPAG